MARNELSKDAMFQLALPRRERPKLCNANITKGVVSTRAPAKGATSAFFDSAIFTAVSTRAPAKGATGHESAGFTTFTVSTRAPAKGAT